MVISKNLAELMGGEIWVESQEDKGSTFRFTINFKLPDKNLSVGESKEDNELATERAIAQLQNTNILLVEDNEINRELAFELLVSNGISVEAVNNGTDAVIFLESSGFDGVLMDCQMPVMDGYEATRRIRQIEQHQNLPILALSANAMKNDREKILACGMDDHITKPINPDILLQTMAKWINLESNNRISA